MRRSSYFAEIAILARCASTGNLAVTRTGEAAAASGIHPFPMARSKREHCPAVFFVSAYQPQPRTAFILAEDLYSCRLPAQPVSQALQESDCQSSALTQAWVSGRDDE